MRTLSDLHAYQKKAVNFQCSLPETALWVSMGLGKTVITLTSIKHLQASGYLRGVIIVAPIRVCRLVWRQEALKWSHTADMKFSVVLGTKDQRARALMSPADVHLINYENLQWLSEALHTYYISKGRELPWNGIVFDEISKMKNSSTHRVGALTKILPAFPWRTGLTGTPAANGYKDLHGQYLVLDGGQRLGEKKTQFMNRWYYKPARDARKEIPVKWAEDEIKKLIGDMTLEMSAEDYNPLPDMVVNDVEVELPDDVRAKYEQMERDYFFTLDSGTDVELFNAASLTNKCLQFANGAVYPVPGMPLWEPVHDVKLDALDEIIDESNGQQILCSYAYRSDAERIMKRFADLSPINLTECKSESALSNAMHRWIAGDCRLMIGHPASMGHGVDGLQSAGHTLVWFGLNWSLDLYEQFNARIRRQGQGVPVICHRILCRDTLDQAQAMALNDKATTQDGLRKAIKSYRLSKEKP